MRILNRLINLLIFAMLLVIGAVCIGAAVSPDWAQRLGSLLAARPRLYLACAGAVGICLALLLALTGTRKKQKERILSFRNEEGAISISTLAITDYLGKLSSEFPSIVKMQPLVAPHRKTIDVVVNLRVKAGPQIHEICEVLQRRVRETMINGLGISEVRHVQVNVKEISPEHKSE